MSLESLYLLPFFVALLLQSCMLQPAISLNNFTDQAALLSFKSHIDQTDAAALLGNWTTETNFCHWTGISCSPKAQRVTSLNLSDMGIHGTISPYIGNLSFLVLLDLRDNYFNGIIPEEIGHLSRLEILILQSNHLEGSIPPSFQYCSMLDSLSLSLNNLTGGIPHELGFLTNLRRLYLAANDLGGAIPSSLGNISTLQFLTLQQTGLRGSIPSSLFNLSSLVLIDFTRNNLVGTLPVDLCHHWPNIQEIFFSFNQFGGKIPSNIHLCKELVTLSLSTNRFDGIIPRDIWNLTKLESLYLGRNNLSGGIPPGVGNVSTLELFSVEQNYMIEGSFPADVVLLPNLHSLNLAVNKFTGIIPRGIFNMSSLRVISLTDNRLSGHLPIDALSWLPNLEILYIGMNDLHGNIPPHVSNITNLIDLDLGTNYYTGPIPSALGNLEFLQYLTLINNQLTGEPGNPELGFLSALSGCRYLKQIALNNNPLNGIIPDSIANLSSSLEHIKACDCQLQGHIPKGIGSFRNLTILSLCDNNLKGYIPATIGGLERLQGIYLQNNALEGSIPEELCRLRLLGEIFLGNNSISGTIPDCIGELSYLQDILLSSNRLTSSIPEDLWSLENMVSLSLSSNMLTGQLPRDMRKMKVIHSLNLSGNQLGGNIPSGIGTFETLNFLDLSRNSFQGPIPETFGNMLSLVSMDLSHNNLSGPIPMSLEKLKLLKYLNLSVNELSGEIPGSGAFENFTSQSFLNNGKLCGEPSFGVRECSSPTTSNSRKKQLLLKIGIPVAALVAVLVMATLAILNRLRRRDVRILNSADPSPARAHRMISYYELRRATTDFCESNLVGVGSYGSVYKGVLSDGTFVAVKVLNLQSEGAFKSFDAECSVLRTVRHRNIVKVITSCSNPELRALVLEYMSNGSLDKWLYSHNYCLNLLQRVTIMADVASALEYLHCGQTEPVVHCDLKPSNILLDAEMKAHVGDFGIAKIMVENKDATQTKTLGTFGYIAPEYGSEGKVSTKGDIYSFGITLLEVFTRKRPTDAVFVGEQSLRQWVSPLVPSKIMEVVDSGLLDIEYAEDVISMQGVLLSLMELGLNCSKNKPEERADIKAVVVELNKIKSSLLHMSREKDSFSSVSPYSTFQTD